jgi:hypothetical protein
VYFYRWLAQIWTKLLPQIIKEKGITLKVDAGVSFETLITMCETKQRHIPEDFRLYSVATDLNIQKSVKSLNFI